MARERPEGRGNRLKLIWRSELDSFAAYELDRPTFIIEFSVLNACLMARRLSMRTLMAKLNQTAQLNLDHEIFHFNKGDAMTIMSKQTNLSTRINSQSKKAFQVVRETRSCQLAAHQCSLQCIGQLAFDLA
jgi:hypothetical protein